MGTLEMLSEVVKSPKKAFENQGGDWVFFDTGVLVLVDGFGNEDDFVISDETLSMRWEEITDSRIQRWIMG